MNPAAMSALAVFGGAAIGSLSPVLSNYVLQRRVARRDLINREIAERQKLYSFSLAIVIPRVPTARACVRAGRIELDLSVDVRDECHTRIR
jgi:hypothetical protein